MTVLARAYENATLIRVAVPSVRCGVALACTELVEIFM